MAINTEPNVKCFSTRSNFCCFRSCRWRYFPSCFTSSSPPEPTPAPSAPPAIPISRTRPSTSCRQVQFILPLDVSAKWLTRGAGKLLETSPGNSPSCLVRHEEFFQFFPEAADEISLALLSTSTFPLNPPLSDRHEAAAPHPPHAERAERAAQVRGHRGVLRAAPRDGGRRRDLPAAPAGSE